MALATTLSQPYGDEQRHPRQPELNGAILAGDLIRSSDYEYELDPFGN